MMRFKLTFADRPAGKSPTGNAGTEGWESLRQLWRQFLRALRDALSGVAA
jgi:hypothetical protein